MEYLVCLMIILVFLNIATSENEVNGEKRTVPDTKKDMKVQQYDYLYCCGGLGSNERQCSMRVYVTLHKVQTFKFVEKVLADVGLTHIVAEEGFENGVLPTKCMNTLSARYCQSYNSRWKMAAMMVGIDKEVMLHLNDATFSNFTGKDHTHEKLKRVTTEAIRMIATAEHFNLHCTSFPKVTLKSPRQITVETDELVVFKCDYQSDLPAKIFWTHNDMIINGERDGVLKILAEIASTGVYKCYAENLVGRSASSETTLTVINRLIFIEEPSNVTYTIPSPDERKVSLTCDASDEDQTITIYWYFSRYNEAESYKEVKRGTDKMYVIDKPSEQDNGFYYCKASNGKTEIISRVARIDVLSAILPSANLRMSFDIPGVKGLTPKLFASLLKKMKKPLANTNANVQVFISNTFVTIEEAVSMKQDSNITAREMPHQLVKLRQYIANSLTVFLMTLGSEYTLKLDDGRKVMIDTTTLKYDFKFDICTSGHKLHKNGYMCVQCPCGHAGVDCTVCPMNSYADRPGQTECTVCSYNGVTTHVGCTSPLECISCTPKCKHGKCVKGNLCVCEHGWTGSRCKNDIDECKSSHKCNEICINKNGSYACSCNKGHTLGPDKHTCNNGVATDIIFLIDVSKQFITDSSMTSKVKTFAKDVFKAFKDQDRIRFGIITFSTLAKTLLPLTNHKETEKILNAISSFFATTKDKTVSSGLMELRNQDFGKDSKIIVLAITNGFSKRNRFGTGFQNTRKQALIVQKQGIYLISVGISSNTDIPELHAIASYPKLNYTIISTKCEEALLTSLEVASQVMAGKCYSPRIDIGILFKPYADAVKCKKDKERASTLFQTIHDAFTKQHYYFTYTKEDQNGDVFALYNKSSFRDVVSSSFDRHCQEEDDDGFIDLCTKVLRTDFDEQKRLSLSKIKSLIVVTDVALTEQQFVELDDIKGEVDVINFASELKSVKKQLNGKKRSFSVEEVDLYTKALKEKQSKQIC